MADDMTHGIDLSRPVQQPIVLNAPKPQAVKQAEQQPRLQVVPEPVPEPVSLDRAREQRQEAARQTAQQQNTSTSAPSSTTRTQEQTRQQTSPAKKTSTSIFVKGYGASGHKHHILTDETVPAGTKVVRPHPGHPLLGGAMLTDTSGRAIDPRDVGIDMTDVLPPLPDSWQGRITQKYREIMGNRGGAISQYSGPML